MSVRARIFIILLIFVTVLIGFGAGSIYVSRQQSEYFRISAMYLLLRENMSEAKRIFLSQTQAFDYYIFLSQETERHNFRTRKDELTDMLNEISDSAFAEDYVGRVRDKVWQLNRKYEETVSLAQRERSGAAAALAEREIIPEVNTLKELFDTSISELSKKVEVSRETAASFSQKITGYFITSFSLTLAVMLLISLTLYRSIARPLKKLEKATEEIGKGNLDYRLNLKSRNEFRKIAVAFNKMLRDLKEYQMKITQMSKMAAVGELSGGVAHEINNPLTGILGHAQRLLLKLPQDSSLYPVVKKMEKSALRCRSIVSGLLDFSRSNTYSFDYIDVHDVLRETFTLSETEIRQRNIKIEKEFNRNLPKVRASFRNLQQVFVNVIYNAIHAMPDGGALHVSTEEAEREGSRYLLVKFTDTGVGLSKDISQRVFEPFFTTKDIGQGTGLGLSVSYRIIEDHGGIIEISSPGPGKGAEVEVYLAAE